MVFCFLIHFVANTGSFNCSSNPVTICNQWTFSTSTCCKICSDIGCHDNWELGIMKLYVMNLESHFWDGSHHLSHASVWGLDPWSCKPLLPSTHRSHRVALKVLSKHIPLAYYPAIKELAITSHTKCTYYSTPTCAFDLGPNEGACDQSPRTDIFENQRRKTNTQESSLRMYITMCVCPLRTSPCHLKPSGWIL